VSGPVLQFPVPVTEKKPVPARAREENGRLDTGLRKRAAVLSAVIALIALVVGSVFGDRGILHWMAEQERNAALAREVEELRAGNLRLSADIEALRRDPRAVERIAREELGLARPGEVMLLLRPAR
jgi:cell division protein FtsB